MKDDNLIKLSYSRLADYDRNGARALIDRDSQETTATKRGNLVNDLLFGNVDIEETYFIKNHEDPKNTLLKLANIIVENYLDIPSIEEVFKIIERNELWVRTKNPDKMLANFNVPEFWEYLELKLKGVDKPLITPSMLVEAEELVYILKSHSHSKHFFKSYNGDLITEYPFKVKYGESVLLRGIVDMIVIDHVNKTFRIIDLKTGANKYSKFQQSILEWRYYLQEAVYMYAADEIKKELGVSDYKTLPFQFLYIGITEKIPVVYEVTENRHLSGIHGFTTPSGYTYKGMIQLIDEVEYLHRHKQYEYDFDTHKNNGLLMLRDVIVNVK